MTATDTGTPLVVAIDGPGGSGKSTVARAVARRLRLAYLDTGAMYRALTWAALQSRTNLEDSEALTVLADRTRLDITTDPARTVVKVDGHAVTKAIREAAVTSAVSAVSAVPAVRSRLVAAQQALIASAPEGIVVEGRDIGTVVAPEAPVKVYLTASATARAQRRSRELGLRGDEAVERLESDLARRDAFDSGRAASPLTQAHDAVELDSTELGVPDVVAKVLQLCAAAGLSIPDGDD